MPIYNVYFYDMCSDKIKVINIFDTHTVKEFIQRQKKVKPTPKIEEFSDELRKEVMYQFWSRSEYEIVISAWCGGEAAEKVDIYNQLQNNWHLFSTLAYNEMIKGKRKLK